MKKVLLKRIKQKGSNRKEEMASEMIKACIFDLDGTLLYTLDSMAKAADRMLEELGLHSLPVDNYRYYCGDGAEMLVQRVLTDAGDKDLAHFEEASALYRRYFGEDPLYKVDYFPGIREALSQLKTMGLSLGVCSNKPHTATVDVIERMYPDTFDVCIGQKEGIRRKPFPDTALAAAQKLGVAPEECVYFGDSGTDMKTGKAAGMYTVGVLWGYRDLEELEENGADNSIFLPEDIVKVVETLLFSHAKRGEKAPTGANLE